MKQEIIIAGFGGQGVLSMGKILAYSGLMEDKEVTWMPAYGPEQRGGTANVTVIVSDERISSPILSQYDTAIILNQPSLEKFEGKIKPGAMPIFPSLLARLWQKKEKSVPSFLWFLTKITVNTMSISLLLNKVLPTYAARAR